MESKNRFDINLSSKLTPLFEYVKKQQENRKFLQSVELSITLLIISFFLFFAIRPTFLTISSLVGEIKSKRVLSAEMKAKIGKIISAQDIFSEIQEKYLIVESAYPSRPQLDQATNQIIAISQQNQIPLDKLNFDFPEKNSYFSTQISTQSSFTSGLSFIGSLLSNRRLFDIPSLSFSIIKDSQNSKMVNFSVPINILFWDEYFYGKK